MANRRMLRKGLVLIGGTLLLALGVIGFIMPLMPGFLFFIAGLLLLSTEFEWAGRALTSARAWIDRRRGSGPTEVPYADQRPSVKDTQS